MFPEELYQERLNRYVTAMRNGMPDRVPLRPFAAEITGRYAGYTCQEVTHDYNKAFEAVIRCCADFRLGRRRAQHGLRLDGPHAGRSACATTACPASTSPPTWASSTASRREDDAFMKREEYDELIEDPVRFLYETWLPRVSHRSRARRGLLPQQPRRSSRAAWRC